MRLSRLLMFFCLLISTTTVYSQFGISARLQNNTNKNWNTTAMSATDSIETILNRSYEFGINYWFRLKDYRLEFLPELSFATSKTDINDNSINVIAHSRTSYNFNLNVQLYPLDFYGDCNCPTFSKDGNAFSKGFYWLLSPGVSRHTLSSEFSVSSGLSTLESNVTSLRLGIGAGVDVGVTNLITASPFIQYSMNFGNAWPDQFTAYNLSNPENQNNASNINQWHFGLRLIFRPDYKF